METSRACKSRNTRKKNKRASQVLPGVGVNQAITYASEHAERIGKSATGSKDSDDLSCDESISTVYGHTASSSATENNQLSRFFI